jgi:DNA gyrase subunit A
METKEEDYVELIFVANTHDYILFFTPSGRAYWQKVYEIPEASRAARGKAIVNLLNVESGESIAAMTKVREFSENLFVVFATEKGVVKKTNLAAFSNPRAAGIIAIATDEGDRLIGVKQTEGQNEIVLTTRNGMSIRFKESELRDQGRDTRGVCGITLDEGDRVESLEIVDPRATFLVCTENGYGKRTSFDEYRLQKRGGKGLMTIRTSERNGCIIGAHAVLENDALMLITAQGQMIRSPVADVRVISRVTQGVRLIQLSEGDKLVAATTVEPEDDVAEGAATEGEETPLAPPANGQG